MQTISSRINIVRPMIIIGGLGLFLIAGWFLAMGGETQSTVVRLAAVCLLLALPCFVFFEELPVYFFVATLGISQAELIPGQSSAKPIAILCLGTWLLGLLLRKRNPLVSFSWLDGTVALFFVVNLISIALTGLSDRTASYFQVYMQNLVLYFMVHTVASSYERLYRVVWIFVIGAALSAGVYLFQFSRGEVFVSEGLDRLQAIGIGVNNYAAFIVSALGIGLGLAFTSKLRLQTVLLYVCIPILFMGVVLTKSRGGFLGSVAVILVYGWYIRRRTEFAWVFVFSCVVAILFLLTDLPSLAGAGDYAMRVQSLFDEDRITNTSRPYLWQMALQAFSSHPIFGIGVGNFTVPQVWFQLALETGVPVWLFGPNDVHSLYLGVATDVGLSGFLPFVGMIALSLRELVLERQSSSLPREVSILRSAILAGMFGYLVAAAFVPSQSLPFLYVLLGMARAVPKSESVRTRG